MLMFEDFLRGALAHVKFLGYFSVSTRTVRKGKKRRRMCVSAQKKMEDRGWIRERKISIERDKKNRKIAEAAVKLNNKRNKEGLNM